MSEKPEGHAPVQWWAEPQPGNRAGAGHDMRADLHERLARLRTVVLSGDYLVDAQAIALRILDGGRKPGA